MNTEETSKERKQKRTTEKQERKKSTRSGGDPKLLVAVVVISLRENSNENKIIPLSDEIFQRPFQRFLAAFREIHSHTNSSISHSCEVRADGRRSLVDCCLLCDCERRRLIEQKDDRRTLLVRWRRTESADMLMQWCSAARAGAQFFRFHDCF